MTEADIRAALDDDLALALTLWGEARGEPIEGRIAVGCVIRNRARLGRFGGTTVKAVCLAPAQFSCWRPVGGEANHEALMRQAEDAIRLSPDALMRECLWVAEGILSGAILDRTRGADHYITRQLFVSPGRPGWIGEMAVTMVLGNHVFLMSNAKARRT